MGPSPCCNSLDSTSPHYQPKPATVSFPLSVVTWMISSSDFWSQPFFSFFFFFHHSIFFKLDSTEWTGFSLNESQVHSRWVTLQFGDSQALKGIQTAYLVYSLNLPITSNIWQFCWLTLRKPSFSYLWIYGGPLCPLPYSRYIPWCI